MAANERLKTATKSGVAEEGKKVQLLLSILSIEYTRTKQYNDNHIDNIYNNNRYH